MFQEPPEVLHPSSNGKNGHKSKEGLRPSGFEISVIRPQSLVSISKEIIEKSRGLIKRRDKKTTPRFKPQGVPVGEQKIDRIGVRYSRIYARVNGLLESDTRPFDTFEFSIIASINKKAPLEERFIGEKNYQALINTLDEKGIEYSETGLKSSGPSVITIPTETGADVRIQLGWKTLKDHDEHYRAVIEESGKKTDSETGEHYDLISAKQELKHKRNRIPVIRLIHPDSDPRYHGPKLEENPSINAEQVKQLTEIAELVFPIIARMDPSKELTLENMTIAPPKPEKDTKDTK